MFNELRAQINRRAERDLMEEADRHYQAQQTIRRSNMETRKSIHLMKTRHLRQSILYCGMLKLVSLVKSDSLAKSNKENSNG